MHLSSIRIAQFRNIKEFVGNFSPGIHVIEGQNGQGKTNLIKQFIGWLISEHFVRTELETLLDGKKENYPSKVPSFKMD